MDTIKTQLDQLSDLDDAQVSELQNSVLSEFESVEQQDPTPQSVDDMTALADMLDTVRGEVQRREAQAEELSARAAEAAARVHGDTSSASDDGADSSTIVPSDDTTEEDAPVAEASSITADGSSELSTADVAEATDATPAEAEAAVADEATADAPAEEAPVEEAATELAATDEAAEAPVEEASEAATTEEASTEATETPEAELSTDAPAAAETDLPVEAEASLTEETPIEQIAQEEAPVTAAAEESFEAPADRRPVVASATEAPTAITAGADVPTYSAGQSINDMSGVADAFTKRLHTLRNVNSGDGEQHIVASVTTAYPESRLLTTDAEANASKIDAVTGPEVLVASGGHATPIQSTYDIFGFGTDARPVRDSLPRFQADRGGIRFITPPKLSAYSGAVGIWTNTVDTTPGGATKNSLTVTGATEQTAVTDAVTLQLQIGNFFSRAYPELVARHNELGLIMHARVAELNLLTKINAASTAVTTASIIGFARDFLVQVKLAAAGYRSRSRIDPSTQLQAIIPTWVYDAMAADLTLNMPGDNNLGVTRAEIDSFLALSNVTLTASLDQNSFGAQSAGILLEFPDSFTWFLFSEGSFLFLDGGTLDLGIIRDSTLVGTNDYKMFVETFEGLAFVGIESLAITSSIAVNGVAAALRDTTGGATAAAIEY